MIFKESETVELKKSTSELKEAVISIASILNKHGKGELYFGIKDDGTVLGQTIGNSLCHRDYSNPKGNEVAIFKDRIEIYNPGTFPEELNPEDFFKGEGHSILRNPLIAETMYKSEDIEKWASGLKRIHEECEASHIKVEFKRVKTGFVVCFFRPGWEEGKGLEKGGQKRWPENHL